MHKNGLGTPANFGWVHRGVAHWRSGEDERQGVATWENGSWMESGAPMSADEELGCVYLPVSTPTNDYYGGHRPGDGLYGDSLVCIEAATGARSGTTSSFGMGLD